MRPLAVAVLVVAASFAPAARAEVPLRTRLPLIARLADAAIAPPLPARADAIAACLPSAYPNMWSPLPDPLRRFDQRVTLATFPGGRFELRDALLLPMPRTIALDLELMREPRLDFEYHLFGCQGGGVAHASLRVVIEDATGRSELVVPLAAQRPGEARWRVASIELPALAGAARLTLSFEVPAADRGALVAFAEPAVSGRPEGERGPADTNVLWIVIDSARADVFPPNRAFELSLPTLDRLFTDGTAFRNGYAMSNQTRTSTTAMLGSVHPSTGGFQSHDWELARKRLARFYRGRPALLPLVLEEAGYRVAHIGDENFLWASNPSGVDAGFPHIDDYRVDEQDARLAADGVARFAEGHPDERWFVMLELLAPHTPYKPPPEWQEAADALPGGDHLGPEGHLPRSYVGEMMWVDHNLEALFARLEAAHVADRTLVIVTADHGEVMLRWHDCASARVKLRCGFNHSVTVYDDEIHVPLTFHLPGRVASGRVVDVPVSQADIVPTVLDVLGLPPVAGVAGRSLYPVLVGGEPTPEPVYADGRLASALRAGDWKLIVHAPDDDAGTIARTTKEEGEYARYELFDLAADRLERKNVAPENAEVVTRMLRRLDEVRTELARRFAPVEAPP